MHVLLNNRTDIPEVLTVTEGSVNDVRVARQLDVSIPRGSFLVFDRGYLDFKWWNTLHAHGIFFVTRPKKPTLFVVSGQQADSGGHILADERGWIGNVVHARYPREVRRVRYLNEDGETYEYVTNNFELSGEEIALIYKERWRIELFFKWIKQNLKIKSFLGTSPNAVLSQIWVAMIYYLILSYVKFQTKFDRSLLELSRMVKETLFTRRTIIDLLSLSPQTVYKFRVPEVFQLRLAGV
jgi:IS4 transposase